MLLSSKTAKNISHKVDELIFQHQRTEIKANLARHIYLAKIHRKYRK